VGLGTRFLYQNGSLHNISTKNITDMAEKPPHPPINTIKKFKKQVKIKKKRPPASESLYLGISLNLVCRLTQ
jgi:hypothetical protein